MQKLIAVILAAALLAALFAVPAFAESGSDEVVKVLMTTPGVEVTRMPQLTKTAELEAAIEAGEDLIPAECKLVPGRITVLRTGTVSFDEEAYDVTFKVWSTVKRTIALFFLPEDAEAWEMLSCNLGDVIEGHFTANGTYTLVVGW